MCTTLACASGWCWRAAKHADGDGLVEAEGVFIAAAVGRDLVLLAVAVEIEDFDAWKDAEQFVPHEAERGVVQITVVGDEADDAAAGLLDAPLGQADELDVIVVEPRFSLGQLLAV